MVKLDRIQRIFHEDGLHRRLRSPGHFNRHQGRRNPHPVLGGISEHSVVHGGETDQEPYVHEREVVGMVFVDRYLPERRVHARLLRPESAARRNAPGEPNSVAGAVSVWEFVQEPNADAQPHVPVWKVHGLERLDGFIRQNFLRGWMRQPASAPWRDRSAGTHDVRIGKAKQALHV